MTMLKKLVSLVDLAPFWSLRRIHTPLSSPIRALILLDELVWVRAECALFHFFLGLFPLLVLKSLFFFLMPCLGPHVHAFIEELRVAHFYLWRFSYGLICGLVLIWLIIGLMAMGHVLLEYAVTGARRWMSIWLLPWMVWCRSRLRHTCSLLT